MKLLNTLIVTNVSSTSRKILSVSKQCNHQSTSLAMTFISAIVYTWKMCQHWFDVDVKWRSQFISQSFFSHLMRSICLRLGSWEFEVKAFVFLNWVNLLNHLSLSQHPRHYWQRQEKKVGEDELIAGNNSDWFVLQEGAAQRSNFVLINYLSPIKRPVRQGCCIDEAPVPLLT